MEAQDIVVLLRIIDLEDQAWSPMSLASDLNLEYHEVEEVIDRMIYAKLMSEDRRFVHHLAFREFLFYGLRHVFPASVNTHDVVVRGVPTSYAGPSMSKILSQAQPLVVWRHREGTHEGLPVVPLTPDCRQIAMSIPSMHDLLALCDSLRFGSVRERMLAGEILGIRFDLYGMHRAAQV